MELHLTSLLDVLLETLQYIAMATFLGHAFPGIFFVALGMWWAINVFRHFFASKGTSGIPFRSQPWYPGPWGVKFPVESVVKMVGAAIAITMELVAIAQTGSLRNVNQNAYHVTMFFFFGLNGAMDWLKYRGLPLPDGIETASGVLALGVEGFLLFSHVRDGRPMIDVKIHIFLILSSFCIVLSIFLEIRHRDWPMPALTRIFFTLLHGTWILQVGFIVYPLPGMRKWDLMDHEQEMLASLLYAWHMAVIFVVMLLTGFAVRRCAKPCNRMSDESGHPLLSAETKGVNGHLEA